MSKEKSTTEAAKMGDSYFDIVWQQYKKNTPAYWSLWLLAPLLLLVIFVPLIASNQPLVFHDATAAALSDNFAAVIGAKKSSGENGNKVGIGVADGEEVSVQIRRIRGGEKFSVSNATLDFNGRRYRLQAPESESNRSLRVDLTVTDEALYEHVMAQRGVGVVLSVDIQDADNVEKAEKEFGLTLYPWFRHIFNPGQAVDFLFNMALVGFIPWLIISLFTNCIMKRRGAPGRWRIVLVAGQLVLITTLLCMLFGLDLFGVSPLDKYRAKSFITEDFVAGPHKSGFYVLIPFGPTETDPTSRFEPPFYRKPVSECKDVNDDYIHLLGTDDSGRDVLTRLLYGTRVSISVGFVAVVIYMSIGIFFGAIAGYLGGATDIVISRLIEVVLLFPAFFLILTIVGLQGPSIWIIMFVIGITGWPNIARLIRGEVLKQRAIDYVVAARALGVPRQRIIFVHVLPNSLAPALVAAPFGIASAIITEAGLSLLGFGVRPPASSWGSILQLGNENYQYYWLIVFPSLAMFFAVTVFNLVGSGLRDAMDPRLRA